ncbi:hypothetical protein ACGFSB_29130 [Streptomyces sp. NPDC048441]|uniref:hypothetical protein n=1 Tax=Streptomyces sp. NPDC048441 TaxID=3365552 RepID=UPI003714B2E3
MLAQRFGYSVSERPAAEVTPWAEAKLRDRIQGADRAVGRTGVVGGGAMALLVVAFFAGGDAPPVWAWGILAMPVIAGILFVRIRREGHRAYAELARSLREQPWQTWPVRGQEVTVRAMPPLQQRWIRQQVGGSFVPVRLDLLDPQGVVAAGFLGYLPTAAWRRMTDGYGVLWICGDLRDNCHAVVPRGQTLLQLTPGSRVHWIPEQGNGAGDAGLIADLVAQAQRLGGLFGD